MVIVRFTHVDVYVMGNERDINLLTTAGLPPAILVMYGLPDSPHVSVLGRMPTLSSSSPSSDD